MNEIGDRNIVRDMMTEITTSSDRDKRTGQFLPGSKGGPGRKVGSRNLLTTAFLDDLKTVWMEDGIAALRRCAREDATGFCRIVSSLLPKTLDITMDATEDATDFVQAFRQALALLHDQQRQELKTIEHSHVSKPGSR